MKYTTAYRLTYSRIARKIECASFWNILPISQIVKKHNHVEVHFATNRY